MHKVYLALGSNLGNRQKQLLQAISLINKHVGRVEKCSAIHQTLPCGFESDNLFLNMAICCTTNLEPLKLLEKTQEIEKLMGRESKSHNNIYQDRIIDIDILLYDKQEYSATQLTIPHPKMLERDFVMIPLKEIIDHETINFLNNIQSKRNYSAVGI